MRREDLKALFLASSKEDGDEPVEIFCLHGDVAPSNYIHGQFL